jgi:ribosome recycling factor
MLFYCFFLFVKENDMSIENEVSRAMEDAIAHLTKELKTLRTGRANPALLDTVVVEVYGTKMKIKDVANVTVPESRQILVSPYDANNANAIAKAIDAANLSVQAMVDGNVVRINIPPMDEAIRKDMVKQCKKKSEETKISIREIRRKFNDLIRKQKADGEMPEDMMKQMEKKIQELTDKYCKLSDTTCVDKEKEILEI